MRYMNAMRRAALLLSLLAGCAPALPAGEAAGFPTSDRDLQAANEALGDPYGGRFPFAEAIDGLPSSGVLRATLHTDEGPVPCVLQPERTPLAVANFVGLARGRRPFRNEAGAWVREPYYLDVPWHRAIEGQFAQTGRRGKLADGGFLLQDEVGVGDDFSRPGVLAMAGLGDPDTSSVQFFVTTGPAKQLSGQHTVLGHCDADATMRALERRVLRGETPLLKRIEITRG